MKLTFRLLSLLAVVMILVLSAAPAKAALQAVGPVDPVTTIPTYYQDLNNLALQPCLDQNGFCILTPNFDPGADPLTRTPPGAPLSPITTTGPISATNFPDESFYFITDSIITTPTGAKLVYRAAMEAAFLAGVTPNTGITFLRINFKKASGLTPNSTYTVTHPYGTFNFTTDGIGDTIIDQSGQAFRAEDPLTPAIGIYFPPEMQTATTTHIGPFLTGTAGLITDIVSGHQYIGDAVTPVTVTGSPFGTNFFRVDGPNINPGAPNPNRIETNLFTLAGRVYTGTIASPMTINRATYARDALSGQIDTFVTALPTSVLTIGGTGITTGNMTQDAPNTGKFFTHIALGSSNLPASFTITNSLDAPTIPHPIVLVDEVIITQATYNPVSKALTVKAASRDRLTPLPTLTAANLATPNTLDATGTLVKTLTTTIPPASVVVTSSKGGSATAAVTVLIPPTVPVAAADSATTPFNNPVTVNVTANDTTPGTLDLASVVIASPSANGQAVPTPAGAVVFMPTPGFTGQTTFTYTVKDTLGQASNAATVTVTVGPPPIITAAAAPNGTISPAGALSVPGGNQTYTITPNAGFVVSALVVDGTILPGATTYTFNNVAADHYINAYFEPLPASLTITAAADTGGTISPAGATAVAGGASQTFTITPGAGNMVAALVVDGTVLPGATSYTFNNVTTNHYINAYFGPLPATVTITANAGPNGTISPAGASAVPGGSNQTYTITPNTGFTVAALVVDGTLLPGATSYTFTNVVTDHYINAYFQ